MKIYFTLIACLALIHFQPVQAQNDCNCAVTLTPEDHYIDGGKYDISPGDTICLMAGHYKFLNLRNFHGSPDQRITFINCGGQVVIGDPDHYYGLSMVHNSHYRLTGTGSPNFEYGIKIIHHGVGVSGQSTDFEIDHIESYQSGFAGFIIKTDPQCDDPATWKENFVMKNVSVHDNKSSESYGEGMYIGFSTNTKKCDNGEGGEFTIYPHVIENISVYNNKILSSGWDGIQVSKGEDCKIYDNYIINYGQSDEGFQKYGMVIGGRTTGKIYNNTIIRGTSNSNGSGMAIFATRNNIIFNNLIVDAGEDGIFWDDRPLDDNDVYEYVHIINNTIIRPARDGIRTYALIPQKSKIYNNLIVAPGSLGDYQYVNNREFLFLDRKGTYDTASNVFMPSFEAKYFIDPGNLDFRITDTSPAKDAGVDVSQFGILFDLEGKSRPYEKHFDAGALEYHEPLALPEGKLPQEDSHLRGYINNEMLFIEIENNDYINDINKLNLSVYEITGRKMPVEFEPVIMNEEKIVLSGVISPSIHSRILIILATHEKGVESLKIFRYL